MSTRILINGATGKMGQITVKTLSAHPDFEVVAALSQKDALSLEIKKHRPDIVIDFTTALVVFKNTQTIIDANVRPVIGTTGLTPPQIKELQAKAASQKLGGLIVPNFSVGALLMMKTAANIARYFPTVEIIEMHHAEKADSPSGTSIRTAEMIAAARQDHPVSISHTKETLAGARGALCQQIPIHSVRLPGLVAHQHILFGGMGETLTLRHDTIDRQCFMPGVILACQTVLTLDHLVYGLENFL